MACSRDQVVAVGARSGGAHGNPRVWHSVDGRTFTIEENVPGLADDDLTLPSTLDREPVAWTSPDGRGWERHALPGGRDFDDVERVVSTGDGLVALGLSGDHFGVWRRDADSWERGDAFGVLPEEARNSPFVSSLVTGERGLCAPTTGPAAGCGGRRNSRAALLLNGA